jgi:CRISPR/Cas system Type II protein with McrA/HNH and RuvC-like nuclease domain
MKKILGLDLGVTSIGWAVVAEYDDKKKNFRNGKQDHTSEK